jgi:integrase
LSGVLGSAEFLAAYQEALGQPQSPIGASRTKHGTVNAALIGYYDSARFFGSLAPSTQTTRRQTLERFRAEHGDRLIAELPPKFISWSVDKMSPHVAKGWIKALRHLMAYAIVSDMARTDPTAGIKIKLPKSDGIHAWSEDEIATFEAAHPIGTKPRLALALLIYTAQRRGDVIRMGRQHIRDGVLQVRQNKTGTTLAIPVHADLQAIVDATPSEHLTFLVNRNGTPFTASIFSWTFGQWAKAAGLPDECTPHGLRKAACRRLAEAGCTAHEIMSISGHKSLAEVERYTRAADQAHMARNAMARRGGMK